MRVNAYIDGFNLYYGMRGVFGKDTQGWRWLDIRSLINTLNKNPQWGISSIKYLMARVKPKYNQSGTENQKNYIEALLHQNSISEVIYGFFSTNKKIMPLHDENNPIKLSYMPDTLHTVKGKIPVAIINPTKNPTSGGIER